MSDCFNEAALFTKDGDGVQWYVGLRLFYGTTTYCRIPISCRALAFKFEFHLAVVADTTATWDGRIVSLFFHDLLADGAVSH